MEDNIKFKIDYKMKEALIKIVNKKNTSVQEIVVAYLKDYIMKNIDVIMTSEKREVK